MTAPSAAFDEVIARTREQLTERSARIRIRDVIPAREFMVQVENLTGHKFPTAHPSRRAWLRVRVLDSARAVLFDSGRYDERGRILGPDGTPLPAERAGGPIEPHHAEIDDPKHVQVYESVMAAPDGKPTFSAMRAAGYRKDNRLLPRGYLAKHADAAATKPAGIGDDEDFQAGSDTVIYQVEIPDGVRVYTIEVDLLYQTLSARFADELFTVDAPAVKRFQRMYAGADPQPIVVAHARLSVVR